MARGVVWTGPGKRLAVALVSAVLLLGPAAGVASAGQLAPPKKIDGRVLALQDQWGDATANHLAVDDHGVYQANQDAGSLATVDHAIGAKDLWGQHDTSGKAVTGQGVTVAVLDSGVEPVPGLSAAGKVVQGPDLSLEANSDADRGQDTYGHGTFLAGIIAARDTTGVDPSGNLTGIKDTDQDGIAPGAKILAVKAATADGSTDVSEIIAGLDWIVAHRNDNGMNVRVINLSFGTDSVQSYQIDPLAEAAENAWRHGIVVVASAGNEGNNTTQLTDPAMDPYLVAVGATDSNLAVDGWQSPLVASFSNGGGAARHVDVVAPGKSIVSLRDPGSYIDTNHPEGLVLGDASGRLFRGSGTSQAAAVVSGGVALLAQAFPTATPDMLKAALMASADPVYGTPTKLQGSGQIDLHAAYDFLHNLLQAHPDAQQLAVLATMRQTWTPSSGLGSLDAARGGNYLVDPATGDPLTGEVDVQGYSWNAQAWTQAESAGTAWQGGSWNGEQYTGGSWTSSTVWASARWSSARWSGARWTDADWDSARWSSARWSSARWSSARWSSARWSCNAWN